MYSFIQGILAQGVEWKQSVAALGEDMDEMPRRKGLQYP